MKRSLALASVFAISSLSMNAYAVVTAETPSDNWRAAMIGPGSLSLQESKIAEEKASNAKVKEFSKFETAEQTGLGTVLKELNTPTPEMSAKDKATLQKLKDAPAGPAFDKAYIDAQIEGHKTLADINGAYLNKASALSNDPKENEARHLAILIKATIDQHIANTTEIAAMLNTAK